jgi:metal-responsive CopG/Arc/MetJ family transcriptional regulator
MQPQIRRQSHNTKTISLSLPEDVLNALNAEAQRAQVSRSLMLSQILRSSLNVLPRQEAR